jgi:stage V sporulation protein B
MTTVRQPVRGTFVQQAAILALAGIVSRILGFVLRIPLTNVLGDEGIGIYGDGHLIFNFFIVISMGLPLAISKLTRERMAVGRRDEAHRIFKTALLCSFLLGFGGSMILWFGASYFADLIKNPRSYYTLLALSPAVTIVAVMAVFRGYFQGAGTMAATALSQFVEQVFNLIFSIVLMFAFMDIVLPEENRFFGDILALGAAGGHVGTLIGAAAGLLVIALLYVVVRPTILRSVQSAREKAKFSSSRKRREVKSFDIVKALVITTIPFILATAVYSLSNFIDSAIVKNRLMHSGMEESEAVAMFGIYTGKYVTITTFPIAVSMALAVALIPSLAGSRSKSEAGVAGAAGAVQDKIGMALKVSMIVSFPAAIGIGVLAGPILHMLFPNAPDGAGLLFFGAPAVIFVAVTHVAAGALQGTGYIIIPVIAAVAGVLLKIPLNYILCAIPAINVYGAIISTTVCYLLAGGINLWWTMKLTGARIRVSIFLRPLFAGVGMGLTAYAAYHVVYVFAPSNFFATVTAIFVGFVSYIYYMVLLNGFNRRDLGLFPGGARLAGGLMRRGWIR